MIPDFVATHPSNISLFVFFLSVCFELLSLNIAFVSYAYPLKDSCKIYIKTPLQYTFLFRLRFTIFFHDGIIAHRHYNPKYRFFKLSKRHQSFIILVLECMLYYAGNSKITSGSLNQHLNVGQ